MTDIDLTVNRDADNGSQDVAGSDASNHLYDAAYTSGAAHTVKESAFPEQSPLTTGVVYGVGGIGSYIVARYAINCYREDHGLPKITPIESLFKAAKNRTVSPSLLSELRIVDGTI